MDIPADDVVPDDFLSWLMTEKEDKNDLNFSPHVKREHSSSFDAIFEATTQDVFNSCSSGESSNQPLLSMEQPQDYTNSLGVSSTITIQSTSSSNDAFGNHGNQCDNHGGEDVNKEETHDSKVGTKRKAPRSREIAKECRRRQRERKEQIENRVATLKKENEELREHFQNVSQRTTDIQRQRATMESIMQNRLCDIENLPEDCEERKNLTDLVSKFTDLYADYGSCRQKEIAFHLAQLEKLILPTRVTKMILWTLQQDYKFFEEKSSPIWGILVKELEMTPDQINILKKQRSEVLKLLLHLRESLSVIRELKSSIKDKHESFDRECGKIASEASAQQNVRFILWITKNTDKLAKVIPDFERSVPHVSHAPDVSLP